VEDIDKFEWDPDVNRECRDGCGGKLLNSYSVTVEAEGPFTHMFEVDGRYVS
jgi:hypothetical protein